MNVLKIAASAGAAIPPGPENPWDLAYASLRTVSANAFDVTKSFFTGITFATGLTGCTGLFFKPDGTKMYVINSGADSIRQYSLSPAWDITSATTDSTFSVSALSTTPTSLYFSPDGTHCYFVDQPNDVIEQLSLSTAWDISTASSVRNFSVATEETDPRGVFFKTDGTKMYVIGITGDDVNEYNLSTAWNISTASYSQNFSVSGQETAPQGVFFSDDGTKMYISGDTGDDINYYTLSTAWNVTTASFVGSIAAGDTSPRGAYIKDDGLYMYVIGSTGNAVREFVVGDRLLLSSSQDATPEGIFFKPDGTKMYMIGIGSDYVNEYDLSTAWLVSSATYLQRFLVGGQDTAPNGLFFKPDGTEMYVMGSTNDSVYQYTLSTAWNVSTASFTRSFSISAQELTPQDIFFKDDGTKMYVLGSVGDDINEYSLSTAWNISTASFVDTFSVATQETLPRGMFIGDSGTKLYVVGNTDDDINEYTLSTAWDVSTGTYVQTINKYIDIASPDLGSVFFKDDGSLFFVLYTGGTDYIVSYQFS